MKKKLEHLAYCVNRSVAQEEFLFKLCGYDFDMLLEFEAVTKARVLFGCPGNEDELKQVLALGLPKKDH